MPCPSGAAGGGRRLRHRRRRCRRRHRHGGSAARLRRCHRRPCRLGRSGRGDRLVGVPVGRGLSRPAPSWLRSDPRLAGPTCSRGDRRQRPRAEFAVALLSRSACLHDSLRKGTCPSVVVAPGTPASSIICPGPAWRGSPPPPCPHSQLYPHTGALNVGLSSGRAAAAPSWDLRPISLALRAGSEIPFN